MRHILIIDDDKDLGMLTQKALTIHGFKADVFTDPQAGILHAKANKPNLILMDVMMPGLTGPEIVQMLKNDPQFRDVPVVFLTGLISGSDSDMDEGMNVGGQMYQTLGKPFEIEQLLAIVKRYIP